MVSASLRTRKLIRRGDPIVVAADVGFNWSSARFDSGIQSSLDWQVISMNIDGTQIAFPKMLGRQSIIPNWAIQGGGSGERRIDLPSPLLAKLGNGPHRIGLRIHVRVSHGPSSHNSRPMACVFDQSLSDQMTLVPANAPTLAMVSPTELHAQMYGAFVPHIYAWPSGGLEISMACNNVPVTFMGHVLVRFNGQEQKLDDLQCPKGSYTSGLGWLVETPSGRPDNVDLILRPDSTMPISMIDLTAIWGKDIVFPNLPVEELPHG
jgi:hypothetical protein